MVAAGQKLSIKQRTEIIKYLLELKMHYLFKAFHVLTANWNELKILIWKAVFSYASQLVSQSTREKLWGPN